MFIDVFESAKTSAEVKEREHTVIEAIKAKKLSLHNSSLRDLAEATLGTPAMRKLADNNIGSATVALQESADPVNLTAFSNITGALIQEGVYEAYASPEFIGDKLVTAETSRRDGARVPGLADIDDDAMVVEEGAEFPNVKFGEDYIDVPTSKKRGMKISVTRELVFFDETGRVLEMAQSVGSRLGLNKEKRILSVVIGGTNNYNRKGVAANTYLTSGNRINDQVQTLTDWTSVDDAMQLFADMRDDRATAEPIMVMPDTMIVTSAKLMTAKSILSATEVRTSTNSAATQTIHANPVSGSMSIVSSRYLDWMLTQAAAAGGLALAGNVAKDYWFIGQPKKAFRYRTLFPMQVLAATNDKNSFERDVVAEYRADERGVAYTRAPWYMVRNKPS